MKKLLLSLISIFVLVNFAFAQSTQQKIDSLKREQVKAEQAKKLANDKLRQNSNEKNYEDAKVAMKKMEKVNKELEVALNEQKAEAEAKAKAKAEAEAKAKEAQDKERLKTLYDKRFPEFAWAGVGDPMKSYMLGELKKNPNWDIKNITFPKENEIVVKSTSNSQGKLINVSNNEAIAQAWAWRKDPVKSYEAKKGMEKMPGCIKNLEDINRAARGYYYGYTGRELRKDYSLAEFELCTRINIYRIDIPNNGSFFQITYSTKYGGIPEIWMENIKNYFDVRKVSGVFFNVTREGCRWFARNKFFDHVYESKATFPPKEGRHLFCRDWEFEDGSRCTDKWDRWEKKYKLEPIDLKRFQKLLKTYKVADYCKGAYLDRYIEERRAAGSAEEVARRR